MSYSEQELYDVQFSLYQSSITECPACHTKSKIHGSKIESFYSFGGIIPGNNSDRPFLSMAQIVCNKCGHIMLFHENKLIKNR